MILCKLLTLSKAHLQHDMKIGSIPADGLNIVRSRQWEALGTLAHGKQHRLVRSFTNQSSAHTLLGETQAVSPLVADVGPC